MKRKTARVAVVLVATLVLALTTATVLLKSSWGEDRARLAVENAVSQPHGAHLVMDRLGDFEMFSPLGAFRGRAENLRVLGPDGVELFRIGEVSAELDLTALLSREFYVRNLSISGAEVPVDANTGRPKVALPPARRTAFQPRLMDLRLDNAEIVGLYFIAKKEDGEKAIVGRLAGRLDVTVLGDVPGVRMNVRGVKGVLSRPRSVRLHDATGGVDTNEEMAADIRFSADTDGNSVTGRLKYYPRDRDNPLRISVENIRSVGGGNPLDALSGAGLPMDLLKGMGAPGGQGLPIGRSRR